MTKTKATLLAATMIAILSATVAGHSAQPDPVGWWVLDVPGGGDRWILLLDADGQALIHDGRCWAKGEWFDGADWIILDFPPYHAWKRLPKTGSPEVWECAFDRRVAFPCGPDLSGCPDVRMPAPISCDSFPVPLVKF